jgi:5-methylcytosine-specific restriction endonuclease McrA
MRAKLRQAILKRDSFTCHYCGGRPDPTRYWHEQARRWVALIHVDHVTPRVKGGTDDPSNLVAACGRCNREKYDKDSEAHSRGGASS